MMIVAITGANDFERRNELDALTKKFADEHGDMAVERYDGENTSADRMREALQSLPFLTVRKLVILREPGKQKAFSEQIEKILRDSLADSTDAVIYEPKLDKRGSYYKTLKKMTDFREYGDLDAGGLAAWAVKYVKEHDGVLQLPDARLLIDRIGPTQQMLRSELDKLLAFDASITKQTIEQLTEPAPQSTIFELLEAAFAGNKQQAFALYKEQRALKVEPQAIIGLLAWQLHVLALAGSAAQRSADQIAQESRLNPFVVRKSLALARRLNSQAIRGLVDDLLTLDVQLKRSSVDADEALQLYLLQLTEL